MSVPSAGTSSRRRWSKTPGLTHIALMVALLLVFAVLTFAPPPSSPPAIAEVAPRALEQITEAPVEQAVSTGGQQGGVPRKPGKPTSPSPAPVKSDAPEVPSPFSCIGAVPRQIEDPQSPPCVPLFKGDNGGATYQGVTKDTITVVVPDDGGSLVLKAYEGFFNRRFQFYGRKLRLIPIAGDKLAEGDAATTQQDLAAKVDREYRAFASLPMIEWQGTTYMRELARRKILGVAVHAHFSQPALESMKPYVWQYTMALDRIMNTTGNWLCKRLAGKAAEYTADPTLLGRKRVFGLLYQDTAGNPIDPRPIQHALSECGEKFAVVRHLQEKNERGDIAGPPYSTDPELRATVLAFKDAGVTSIACLCQVPTMGSAGEYASSQAYFPEWQVATYNHQEILFVQQANNKHPRQRDGLIGLSLLPRLQRAANDPSIWALREQDPTVFVEARDDDSIHRQLTFHSLYRPLLLLASGIQMAGPRLTPETFAAGLQRTVFPNPESPLQAGKVGFLGGSFSMTTDAAEFWWSNAGRSPYPADAPGSWCYVAGGQRRRGGVWPGEPAFRQGACDSVR